jgi:hypothetical protein
VWGEVGECRGFIRNLEGNSVAYYTWGLGNVSNNTVEVYAFLEGIMNIFGFKQSASTQKYFKFKLINYRKE